MLKCAINIFNVFTYTPIQIHQCYFILLYFFALDPLELSKQSFFRVSFFNDLESFQLTLVLILNLKVLCIPSFKQY